MTAFAGITGKDLLPGCVTVAVSLVAFLILMLVAVLHPDAKARREESAKQEDNAE